MAEQFPCHFFLGKPALLAVEWFSSEERTNERTTAAIPVSGIATAELVFAKTNDGSLAKKNFAPLYFWEREKYYVKGFVCRERERERTVRKNDKWLGNQSYSSTSSGGIEKVMKTRGGNGGIAPRSWHAAGSPYNRCPSFSGP